MTRWLIALIRWIVPRAQHDWARAMAHEIAAIERPREAFAYALACVGAALRFRLFGLVEAVASARTDSEPFTRGVTKQMWCGIGAVLIGLTYLRMVDAPTRLLATNASAAMIGVMTLIVAQRTRPPSLRVITGCLGAIAVALLVTTVAGESVAGATRWVRLGGLVVQPSLILLPVAVVLFAQVATTWTAGAMVCIAIAVGLQPDRAMATALFTALLAIASVRPSAPTIAACGAALLTMAGTFLQVDRLPAVPYVDLILWSSFRVGPMLGTALWLGSTLLFVPMLLRQDALRSPTQAAFAVCWATVAAAAACGAYPTPVVGYGAAAILGYFLSLGAIRSNARVASVPASSPAGSANADERARERDAESRRAAQTTPRRRPHRLSETASIWWAWVTGERPWPGTRRLLRAAQLTALALLLSSRAASAQTNDDECTRPAVPKVEGPGVWHPGASGEQIPLWPDSMRITAPETDGRPEWVGNGSPRVAGRLWNWATYVSRPTMTVYRPQGRNTGAAMLVLPGGGYAAVAMDLEGTEICDWITRHGVTCVILKYRVPQTWSRDARGVTRPPAVQLPLQDVQRAMGVLRQRAAKYGIDPRKLGVIGFSAGGHLSAAVSNAERRTYAGIDAADAISSVPSFAILLYPGRLWDSRSARAGLRLVPSMRVSPGAPPTLLIHAMNDPVDDVRESVAYGLALHAAGVPVDMRVYAKGCHAFGLRPTADPITTEWPGEAVRWLQNLGMLATSDLR